MYRFLKRLTDIIGSIIGLCIFALAYIPIGIAIKREDGDPVLVKLNRVSAGRTIKLYKFRSMVTNAEKLKPGLLRLNERANGPFFKMKNDPRLTKTGKIIRKFRLDELPQFINVLKGELTLVGPRPHEPSEVIHYPDQYKFLALEKAGLTGRSQIMGASSLPFLKELEYDSEYAKQKNLWLDLKILLKTAVIFLFDSNAV